MLRELPNQFGGFVIPDDKLTPNGGAAAIGHPFGATGTRYVSDLIGQSVNKLGWWAPWTGATVYALGLMLHYGPPSRVSALALGDPFHHLFQPDPLAATPFPPTAALIVPGFWLLVPGAIALIGVTQLAANNYSAITVTLVSMMSIALGMQTGLLLWRSYPQLRRAVRTSHPQG